MNFPRGPAGLSNHIPINTVGTGRVIFCDKLTLAPSTNEENFGRGFSLKILGLVIHLRLKLMVVKQITSVQNYYLNPAKCRRKNDNHFGLNNKYLL